jgi:NADH-quinone oxidoreductase subunit I
MNKFNKYFKDAFAGLWSLLIGMRTTMKIFLRAKLTEQYPENRDTLQISERFRGELVMPHDENNQHKCVGCGLCQIACPNDTIEVITATETDAEGKKKRYLVKYEYDLGSCMFCQLCVNACPHDAIDFSNQFENAVFNRETLVRQLNHEGSSLKSK